jgi:hypothetical protein
VVRTHLRPPVVPARCHLGGQQGFRSSSAKLGLRRQPLTCKGVAVTVQIAAITGFLVDDHIRGAGKLVTGNG